MKTYPLESITLYEAMKFQFRMIDCITQEFHGSQFLTRGDLGVVPGLNKPLTTQKVEQVIAHFFDAEAAVLVRGSGTNAIRYGLHALLQCNETLLIHDAIIYATTATSIEMLGLQTIRANFNNLEEIKCVLEDHPEISAVLIQVTRQKMDDSYDIETVISYIKACRDIAILTDDNYAVMKVSKIGTQCGADVSCFSTFKVLGPEGIGCILGKKTYIDAIIKLHYSGGCQTQGWEAMEVLKGLVYAPVSLAIQSQTNEELCRRLQVDKEIPEVKHAYLANAQSKVLLVEFTSDIAKEVLVNAETLGALCNPVGAESKYEMPPLFYRISGTFLEGDPTLMHRMIRINPNRSGPETVIRILKESIKRVSPCSLQR